MRTILKLKESILLILKKIQIFFCPKVVPNYFKIRYAVDYHNTKRRLCICLGCIWVTKYWPYCLFTFPLVVLSKDTLILLEHIICYANPWPNLLVVDNFIDNQYLSDEQNKLQLRHSNCQCALNSHSLVLLPPEKHSIVEKLCKLKVDILKLNTLDDTNKLGYVLRYWNVIFFNKPPHQINIL